ncbi:LysE family translocator [Glycomyces arizonensis]|uniref:LysE family translocator n=1 Tax=Glycomyces arizonensis TaxID=256035 RepID=UPI00040403E9|nr:LysE family translocator [Glycomyces arizonensis]
MPSGGQLLAFIVTSLIVILIPGPSVMFVIGRALSYGRRKAVLTALGNALGVLTAASLVAVGLGAVVQQSALAFAVVKYAGAAYLVYLGVRALRDRKSTLKMTGEEDSGRAALPVFEGFLVGLLNPKAILFFLAILPQFVDTDAGSATLQMLALGGIFAALAAACDSVWSFAAAAARDMLRAPRPQRVLARVGGCSLIGLGVAAAAGERA